MPDYEVFIDGKSRRVEVVPTGKGSFSVRINGKSLEVEVPASPSSLKKLVIRVGGEEHKIELQKITREKPFQIKTDEASFMAKVEVAQRKRTPVHYEPTMIRPQKRTTRPSPEHAEGTIVAPMTGKVLTVRVKKGDRVKAGQTMCILEAMKMENEIAAPKSGVVQNVYVSEGSPIGEGEALFLVS